MFSKNFRNKKILGSLAACSVVTFKNFGFNVAADQFQGCLFHSTH